ncbi:hypothetical protein SLS58_006841 [Diplodia intermedia]|uniref:Uncharacterized protein n=1 Tax=Diplodia intermedia TaxID=856260 RepID=A0ABR3TM91_9PEZI
MTNAPSSPAWDTDCHQVPATPRDASDEKQKKIKKRPNKKVKYEEYVYCGDCEEQVNGMIKMHDSVQAYLLKNGESDTKEAKADSQRIARKMRPGLTRRANSRAAQEDEEPQRNLERVKKVRFASRVEVATKYRFDPAEEGVLSSSRGLVQRVQFRNGKELGKRRRGRGCYAYLRASKRTYRPGKFPTMDILNTSFFNEMKYKWDDANFGHGEHLYALDEDTEDAEAAPLLPRTKPWDDDEDEE